MLELLIIKHDLHQSKDSLLSFQRVVGVKILIFMEQFKKKNLINVGLKLRCRGDENLLFLKNIMFCSKKKKDIICLYGYYTMFFSLVTAGFYTDNI